MVTVDGREADGIEGRPHRVPVSKPSFGGDDRVVTVEGHHQHHELAVVTNRALRRRGSFLPTLGRDRTAGRGGFADDEQGVFPQARLDLVGAKQGLRAHERWPGARKGLL